MRENLPGENRKIYICCITSLEVQYSFRHRNRMKNKLCAPVSSHRNSDMPSESALLPCNVFFFFFLLLWNVFFLDLAFYDSIYFLVFCFINFSQTGFISSCLCISSNSDMFFLQYMHLPSISSGAFFNGTDSSI